jgi:UDP-N-acetylmuramate dehydrogenase
MPEIYQHADLSALNTFKIKAAARHFVTVKSRADVLELLDNAVFTREKRLFLGGGSNILFTGDFNGLVIQNALKGIDVVSENDDSVLLKVGSGENWHAFVMHCVANNLGGVENLSLIPGTVGAAPMQNIGAYGVEVKEVITEVEAIELATGETTTFLNEACRFGYRESIFKHEAKDKYFISSVTLTLTKRNHRFNTSYGAIQDTLKQLGYDELSVKAISDAVIQIRRSKLPDPAVIGNAGSFFKNPSVTSDQYDSIKANYPAVPGFRNDDGSVKIPAGWLIEQCGWKGKTIGNIGVHQHQALVLVNYGGGEGSKLWALAMDIQKSVQEKFNIKLHPEVNIV